MTTKPVSPTSGGRQQVPGQVQRKAAEQRERVEGGQQLALTGNQRDHRLTLALRDYTIASQVYRRKTSP